MLTGLNKGISVANSTAFTCERIRRAYTGIQTALCVLISKGLDARHGFAQDQRMNVLGYSISRNPRENGAMDPRKCPRTYSPPVD